MRNDQHHFNLIHFYKVGVKIQIFEERNSIFGVRKILPDYEFVFKKPNHSMNLIT